MNFLKTESLSEKKIKQLNNAKTLHDTRWLNAEDIKYQEIILLLRKTISAYLATDTIQFYDNTSQLQAQCNQKLQEYGLSSDTLDDSLIEVLCYEQRFRRNHKA